MKQKDMMQYLSENTHRFLVENEDDEPMTMANPDQEDLFGKSGTDDKPRTGKEFQKPVKNKWAAGKWSEDDLVAEMLNSGAFEQAIENDFSYLLEGQMDESNYDLELGWGNATAMELFDAIDTVSSTFYDGSYDSAQSLLDELINMIGQELGNYDNIAQQVAKETAASAFADDADMSDFVKALNETEIDLEDYGVDYTEAFSGLRKNNGSWY